MNLKTDIGIFSIITKSLSEFNCNINITQNKKSFKYVVNINTFNRKEYLMNLLNQLNEYSDALNHELLINIFDDHSDNELTKYINHLKLNINYFRTNYNHSKEEYWKIWDFMIKFNSTIDAELYFFVPDDISLKPKFFNNVETIWNKIIDKKICLSFGCDDNRKFNTGCWTNFKPIVNNNYYIKTQFNDLLFVCASNFFAALDFNIKPITNIVNMKSSGVGYYISTTLSKKFNLFHTYENYVIHNAHKSKMRPNSTKFRNHKRLIIT